MAPGTRVLAETADAMLGDLDKLVRGFTELSPEHRALDEVVRRNNAADMAISLSNSIALFLRLARDLRPTVETDHEWEMRGASLGWARRVMNSGVVDLPGLLKISTSAHVIVMRQLLSAIPDDHVVGLLSPLGQWHDTFFTEAHRHALESLRTVPPLHGRQRTGDQHRNWLLNVLTSSHASVDDYADQVPARLFVVVLRAAPPVLRTVLDGEERLDSWWTVWRPTPEQLIVVGDLARAAGDWLGDTLLALRPDSSTEGVIAADSGSLAELRGILAVLRAKVAEYQPRPLRPAEVLSGRRLTVLDSVSANPAATDRFARMLAQLSGAGELTRSVQTLLTCDLNLSKAAELLAVHRSTLVYRLDRVARLTGVDPRTTEGAALWWIALGIGRHNG